MYYYLVVYRALLGYNIDMHVKTACNISRFGQAGCYDRKGRFLLAEKDLFRENKITVDIYKGNGQWKKGSSYDLWNNSWQPIAPKEPKDV